MKLLFLLTNFPGFGGIEKVTDYICSYLVSKGFDITILAFGTNQPSLVDNVSGRFNLMFMPEAQGYTSKTNTDYLRDVLTSNDFDFVVLQDSYAPVEHNFREIDYPWKEKLIVVEHSDPMYIIRGLSLNTGNVKTDLLNLLRRLKRQYKNHQRHSLLRRACRRYVLLSESYRKSLELLTFSNWGGATY